MARFVANETISVFLVFFKGETVFRLGQRRSLASLKVYLKMGVAQTGKYFGGHTFSFCKNFLF